MSSLKWFAKREHVPRDFVRLAADITVAAVDGSFSSAGVVSLLGLVAGDWVRVSGYAAAGTEGVDGWHQLSVDSTAAKITTTSVLPDVVAGASVRIEGFLHGDGQEYSLDLKLSEIERDHQVVKKEFIAKSGRKQTRIIRDELYWEGRTQPILKSAVGAESQIHLYREAFASLLHGEVATLDPEERATLASPVGPVSVVLVGSSIPEKRDAGMYFSIPFRFKYYPF